MKLQKFLIGTVVVQALLVAIKVFFVNFLNMESWLVIGLMWIVIVVVLIAMERRQGVLNYLEDFMLTIVWTVLSLVLDLLITIQIVGSEVLREQYFWVTYLITAIALVAFHKKQHIANRQS